MGPFELSRSKPGWSNSNAGPGPALIGLKGTMDLDSWRAVLASVDDDASGVTRFEVSVSNFVCRGDCASQITYHQ